MRSLRRLMSRVSQSVRRRGGDERLREELAQHLDLLTEEYQRAGVTEVWLPWIVGDVWVEDADAPPLEFGLERDGPGGVPWRRTKSGYLA